MLIMIRPTLTRYDSAQYCKGVNAVLVALTTIEHIFGRALTKSTDVVGGIVISDALALTSCSRQNVLTGLTQSLRARKSICISNNYTH